MTRAHTTIQLSVHVHELASYVTCQHSMASQPPTESTVFEIDSYVRGYHAYMDVWQPQVGEVLTLQREPHNPQDQQAVSVVRSGLTVGHVPYNLAPSLSNFLKRAFNKETAEITGDKVIRGGGYGLQVPCIYRLYGPKAYVERAKKMLTEDTEKVRVKSATGSELSQN